MLSLNKVQLIGHLGRDPETRATQDGQRVCQLSVATSDAWKDKATGERKEKTEWSRVVIFNDRLTDIAETHLRKGSKVYVEGKMQTRKWTDKDGVEKYTTEVVLSRFNGELIALDPRERDDEGESPAPAHRPPLPKGDDLDDEIPF